jgi:DNA-binding transcriptional regulator GbsR (MarR family)
MKLTPAMEQYVLHWGEMGTRWGVNRSVAQVHALLFLADKPMHADEIVETLEIARSNVSTSLKELQGWGLVSLSHVLGDRRDHFVAEGDLWTILMTIVEERKRREIDPTLSMLRKCAIEAADDSQTPADVKAKIDGMLEFMETLTGWYDQIKSVPKPTLVKLMKLGAKVARFVSK